MVAVFVALGASEGGYFERGWLPAALFATALLGVSLLTISTRAEVPRVLTAAVGLLAAYAVWSYLSIAWADDRGAALEGANRALMYALVFALFALWPIRSRAAAAVLGAFGLGIAGLGLVTVLRADAAADASSFFVYGRFVAPLGYTNATVALWFSGVFACLTLAARREVWPPLRGLALGGAGLLCGMAVLTQSRGWLYTLPLALVLLIVIVPARTRISLAALAVGVGLVVALGPILDVFAGIKAGGAQEPLIGSAAGAILMLAGALAVVGLVAALFDRSVSLKPVHARRANLAVGALLAVLALAAVVIGLTRVDDPAGQLSQAWEDFKAGGGEAEQFSATTRFGFIAAGQERYDYWRVALDEFRAQPLIGVGTDNFQQDYLVDGESLERPRYPHSFELRALAQTGLVGSVLLAGAIGLALFAALRAARRRSGLGAAVAGAAAATFLYWVVHGSVDWFWEIPALGAPAFAMLGLAAGLTPRRRIAQSRRPGSNALVGGPARTVAVVLSGAVALVVLGSTLLAQREIDEAIAIWPSQPQVAFRDLSQAARLNPVSSEPFVAAGAIALRLEEPRVAQREFRNALARDPRSAYSSLQVGALSSQLGQREDAVAQLERASALAPRDEIIRDVLSDARAGERLDAGAIYDDFLAQRRLLTGP